MVGRLCWLTMDLVRLVYRYCFAGLISDPERVVCLYNPFIEIIRTVRNGLALFFPDSAHSLPPPHPPERSECFPLLRFRPTQKDKRLLLLFFQILIRQSQPLSSSETPVQLWPPSHIPSSVGAGGYPTLGTNSAVQYRASLGEMQ